MQLQLLFTTCSCECCWCWCSLHFRAAPKHVAASSQPKACGRDSFVSCRTVTASTGTMMLLTTAAAAVVCCSQHHNPILPAATCGTCVLPVALSALCQPSRVCPWPQDPLLGFAPVQEPVGDLVLLRVGHNCHQLLQLLSRQLTSPEAHSSSSKTERCSTCACQHVCVPVPNCPFVHARADCKTSHRHLKHALSYCKLTQKCPSPTRCCWCCPPRAAAAMSPLRCTQN
jgi:hypothetical protein